MHTWLQKMVQDCWWAYKTYSLLSQRRSSNAPMVAISFTPQLNSRRSDPKFSYASPQNSQHTPCSLLDVPHGDILMFNDPFFNNNQSINNDPLINNDPPARSESPLQDRTSIHRHPLIIWCVISCETYVQVDDAAC